MFYQPELMTYLWVLPVLVMVVLPALWTVICMLYQLAERSRLADVRGFIDLNALEPAGYAMQEKRTGPRIRIEGPKANVAREVNCCQAYMANISHQGICFTDIPQKMYEEAGVKLKVVFRTRERDYRMFVEPKWRKKKGDNFMLGAAIIGAPPGWKCFIDGFCGPMITAAE